MLNLLNHWLELKYKIFYYFCSFFITFCICFLYNDVLTYFVSIPLFKINPHFLNNSKGFIFTSLMEGFHSSLFISFHFAIIFTLPLFFFLLYNFLKPGLFKREKSALNLFFVCESFGFILSCIFTFFILLPNFYTFFLSFEQTNDFNLFKLSLEAKIFDYIHITINLFWLSFLLFQIPLSLALLLYCNVVKINFLLGKRREILLLSFIFGALFSPPDVFSQLVIAILLYSIFELISISFVLKNCYQNYINKKYNF